MWSTGHTLADSLDIVPAFTAAVPSSASPKYISLKNVDFLEIVIRVTNATTVTGSAITINQATAVAGTGAKALSFVDYYQNIDTDASSVNTRQVAASNTFTTNNTNSKNLLYRIPIRPSMLDVNNGYDCIQVGLGNATAATVSVWYNVVQKYTGNAVKNPNLLAD